MIGNKYTVPTPERDRPVLPKMDMLTMEVMIGLVEYRPGVIDWMAYERERRN